MKYTVKWIEQSTTSTGKVKANLTLVDSANVETNKVTVWGDFPGFKELRPAGTVEGDIVVKQNGQYTNKTLYPAKTDTLTNPKAPAWATKGLAKSAAISVAMEKKQEGIERAQENKADSIRTSSTMRDAVLIVTSFFANSVNDLHTEYQDSFIKDKIQEYRTWLLNNWDVQEPPFK